MGFESPNVFQTPNELADKWMAILSDPELRVLLYIVRRTLGFSKDADPISIKQFTDGITTRDGRVLDSGCGVKSRTSVVKALTSLEARDLIISEKREREDGSALPTVFSLKIGVQGGSPSDGPRSPSDGAFWSTGRTRGSPAGGPTKEKRNKSKEQKGVPTNRKSYDDDDYITHGPYSALVQRG